MLSRGQHVLDGGGELVRPGTRDDDGIAPAMRFLGNAKKSSPIVLAEFHIEVLPLDLDLLRFDNIVHSGAECGRTRAVEEAKSLPNFNPAKADILPPLQLLAA